MIFADQWHKGTPPSLAAPAYRLKASDNSNAGLAIDMDSAIDGIHNSRTASVNDLFAINIYVQDVINLDTFNADVIYDAAALEVIKTEEGPFLKSQGGTTFFLSDTTQPGKVGLALSLAGNDLNQAPEGTGIIATIQFKVKNITSVNLTANNVIFIDSEGIENAITSVSGGYLNPTANIGSISGRVATNIAGHNDLSITNATVTLQGTSYSATTDNNGNFALTNIPFGNYNLIITAPDFQLLTQAISLSGQSLQVIIPPLIIEQEQCLPGDANRDGRLGLEDAIYILQVLTGIR